MTTFQWTADADLMDWSEIPAFADLPGRVIALQTSALSGQMWALCQIERRPWQFWLPKARERWVACRPNPSASECAS
jgi:hypothetical protein